jgi:hypothetical protein
MAFEPQNIKKQKILTLSPNSQAAYGTVLVDGKFTNPVYFDPSDSPAFNPGYFSDMDLAGKGHKFPTKRQRIQNDSAFSFKGPLEAWIAGWLFAWLLQSDTITGAGPFTHTIKPVSSTNQALATTVHMIETADVLYKLPDMVIAKLTISGGSNGPLQFAVDLVGTGAARTNGALGAPPALPAQACCSRPIPTFFGERLRARSRRRSA